MHKRLGDAELEIMQIIWTQAEPMTSSVILEGLKQRQWKLSTLITALERLVDKGFLSCDRTTRTNQYSAQITENDYRAKESRIFLEKLHQNSLRSLLTCLCDSDIGQEDIEALRDYLDTLAEDENR